MTGESFVRRPEEITRGDVAKWFDVDSRIVRWHSSGDREISDAWQVAYSFFFDLVDRGCIKVDFDRRGKKTLTRIPPSKAPVKKTSRPYVDLNSMKLAFDS